MRNILAYKHRDVTPNLFKVTHYHKWEKSILARETWNNSDVIFLLRNTTVNVIKHDISIHKGKEWAYPVFINHYRILLMQNKEKSYTWENSDVWNIISSEDSLFWKKTEWIAYVENGKIDWNSVTNHKFTGIMETQARVRNSAFKQNLKVETLYKLELLM